MNNIKKAFKKDLVLISHGKDRLIEYILYNIKHITIGFTIIWYTFFSRTDVAANEIIYENIKEKITDNNEIINENRGHELDISMKEGSENNNHAYLKNIAEYSHMDFDITKSHQDNNTAITNDDNSGVILFFTGFSAVGLGSLIGYAIEPTETASNNLDKNTLTSLQQTFKSQSEESQENNKLIHTLKKGVHDHIKGILHDLNSIANDYHISAQRELNKSKELYEVLKTDLIKFNNIPIIDINNVQLDSKTKLSFIEIYQKIIKIDNEILNMQQDINNNIELNDTYGEISGINESINNLVYLYGLLETKHLELNDLIYINSDSFNTLKSDITSKMESLTKEYEKYKKESFLLNENTEKQLNNSNKNILNFEQTSQEILDILQGLYTTSKDMQNKSQEQKSEIDEIKINKPELKTISEDEIKNIKNLNEKNVKDLNLLTDKLTQASEKATLVQDGILYLDSEYQIIYEENNNIKNKTQDLTSKYEKNTNKLSKIITQIDDRKKNSDDSTQQDEKTKLSESPKESIMDIDQQNKLITINENANLFLDSKSQNLILSKSEIPDSFQAAGSIILSDDIPTGVLKESIVIGENIELAGSHNLALGEDININGDNNIIVADNDIKSSGDLNTILSSKNAEVTNNNNFINASENKYLNTSFVSAISASASEKIKNDAYIKHSTDFSGKGNTFNDEANFSSFISSADSSIKYKSGVISSSQNSSTNQEHPVILSSSDSQTFSQRSSLIAADNIDIGDRLYSVQQENVVISSNDTVKDTSSEVSNGYRNVMLNSKAIDTDVFQSVIYGQMNIALAVSEFNLGSSTSVLISSDDVTNTKSQSIIISAQNSTTKENNSTYISTNKNAKGQISIGMDNSQVTIGDVEPSYFADDSDF